MSTKAPETPAERKARIALVEVAMRQATLDATTGPKELRSGRFNVKLPDRKPRAAE